MIPRRGFCRGSSSAACACAYGRSTRPPPCVFAAIRRSTVAAALAPGVHSHSIIAVTGNGPVEGSNDGVVEYSSSHLDSVDSEYIVRSTHSTQSNPYTIEEVRRILLLHAADACRRIPCGQPPATVSHRDVDTAPQAPREGPALGRQGHG